jgi:hypothetical protein
MKNEAGPSCRIELSARSRAAGPTAPIWESTSSLRISARAASAFLLEESGVRSRLLSVPVGASLSSFQSSEKGINTRSPPFHACYNPKA